MRHVCLNCPTRWSLITRLRLKSPPAGRYVHRRQGEESLAWRTRAGINQGPNIRVARRDHALERRIDPLEGLQLLEPADIGGLRIDGGLHGMVVPDGLVGFLFGHGVGLQEALPAVRRDLRKL